MLGKQVYEWAIDRTEPCNVLKQWVEVRDDLYVYERI